jgi:hypothetical protein
MPDPDRPRPVDPPDLELIEQLQALQGEEMPADQDAVIEPSEFEARREPTTTEFDRGEGTPGDPEDDEIESLDGLGSDELREGETDDPDVASEEGLTYVPPVDPPTRADAEATEGLAIAAGPGGDALEGDYDDEGSGDLFEESELTGRIREALDADAATSGLADRLVIGTRGSTVVVRGVVDDIDEGDTVVAVIERVRGVEDVIDETELAD